MTGEKRGRRKFMKMGPKKIKKILDIRQARIIRNLKKMSREETIKEVIKILKNMLDWDYSAPKYYVDFTTAKYAIFELKSGIVSEQTKKLMREYIFGSAKHAEWLRNNGGIFANNEADLESFKTRIYGIVSRKINDF